MPLYIHILSSTAIQHVACRGSWSQQLVSLVWWKWKILCLERELNPHLWHSGPVCYHFTMQALWHHYCTHAHLSMQLISSEATADYYIHIVVEVIESLSMQKQILQLCVHIDTYKYCQHVKSQQTIYSKTPLTDHLHRSTIALHRSHYLGPKRSHITIFELLKSTTSLNRQRKMI